MRPLYAPKLMQNGPLNHASLPVDISKSFSSVVPSSGSLNRTVEGSSSFVGLKTSQEGALFAGGVTPNHWPTTGLLKFNSMPAKASPVGQEESERGSTRSSPLGSTGQSESQQPQSPFATSLRRVQSEEYCKSPVLQSPRMKELEESRHQSGSLPAWMRNNELLAQERTTSSSWTPNIEQSSIHLSMDVESDSAVSMMPNIRHRHIDLSLDRVQNDESWTVNDGHNEEFEQEADQPRFYTFL